MNWLQTLFKPLLKAWLKRAIEAEEPKIREQAKDALASSGIAGVNKFLESAEAAIKSALIKATPSWSWLQPYRDSAGQALDTYLKDLEETLDAKIATDGPAAIDSAMDLALKLLLARIDAL